MNNKTKIMLGLSVLTAGTLAAGATGTLAWFTTNKTAKATYTNIKAQSTQGSLNISIGAVTTGTSGSKNADGNAVADGAVTSDVSSKDGLNFYQPDWVDKSGNGDTIKFNSIRDVHDKDGYFTQYTVTVSVPANEANKDKLNISLVGVEITGDVISSWTRVAINTIASKDPAKAFLKADTNNHTYLFQNETSETNCKYIDSAKIATANNTMSAVLSACDPAPAQAKAQLDTKVTDDNWKNRTQGSSFTLGVSVWLEGTMNGDDSQDTALGKTASVTLTFASEIAA